MGEGPVAVRRRRSHLGMKLDLKCYVGAVIGAGFAYFLVNNVLTGVAIARASGEPLVAFLIADLTFQASVNGAMTVLAPVAIAAADQSVWLVPLLLVPAVAVYRAAHVSLEKE